MKSLLLIFFLIISQSNLKLTEKSPYDYSTYSSVSKNKDLTNDSITSSNSDESAVYITESISIKDSQITKESGKASKREDSEFYGVNAAILVQGGKLTMTGGNIITKSEMANALVATNNGEVTITKQILLQQEHRLQEDYIQLMEEKLLLQKYILLLMEDLVLRLQLIEVKEVSLVKIAFYIQMGLEVP